LTGKLYGIHQLGEEGGGIPKWVLGNWFKAVGWITLITGGNDCLVTRYKIISEM
jgi:hypothetical protein